MPGAFYRLIVFNSSQWGGGCMARQSIFVSLQNQTETVNNNSEPIWVMFRELKKNT